MIGGRPHSSLWEPSVLLSDIEEFIVLHQFLGLQGMFRNSYPTGAMLPYMATMARGANSVPLGFLSLE